VPVALDTNILVYAAGLNGGAKRAAAVAILDALIGEPVVIPVQALGELFHVLVRKGGYAADAARAELTAWREGYTLAETTTGVLDAALELAVAHRLAVWDAVILAAAAEAGCEALLTEDLHPGFAWRGCVVRNPFSASD
jgi:predicted nucleic acid-binding protein